jgi:hypothetical protein
MGKQIYDKPTRVLIRDMASSLGLQPGQVLTTTRTLEWFREHYPKLQTNSIKAHLTQASTNDPSRLHHAVKPEDDFYFKVGTGQYRLYEPGKDPAPIHELVPGDVAVQEKQTEHDEPDLEVDATPAGSTEFLLERDLQLYLARNLERIEPGLTLYADEDGTGIEYDAGGRRIDILAKDRAGNLVVLELKVSKGYDRVVGQLLRYVNWVRLNLAEPGQRVRGLIICRSMSEDLRLACSSIPDVELYEYQMSVTVSKVAALY